MPSELTDILAASSDVGRQPRKIIDSAPLPIVTIRLGDGEVELSNQTACDFPATSDSKQHLASDDQADP